MMPIARKVTLDDIRQLSTPICKCGRKIREVAPVCEECRKVEREEELLRAEGD